MSQVEDQQLSCSNSTRCSEGAFSMAWQHMFFVCVLLVSVLAKVHLAHLAGSIFDLAEEGPQVAAPACCRGPPCCTGGVIAPHICIDTAQLTPMQHGDALNISPIAQYCVNKEGPVEAVSFMHDNVLDNILNQRDGESMKHPPVRCSHHWYAPA